jgi:hypothetical protein
MNQKTKKNKKIINKENKMSAENQNLEEINIPNEEQKKETREYEKSDKPFKEEGEDRQKENQKAPGNPELEKTFDENPYNREIISQDKEGSESEDPDEQYSDENKEKGVAKDMNNREREAEKIQENEDTKNDDREIELNRKL